MLSEWLEAYGRTTQLFYSWLLQFDLVTDESRKLIHSVIATMIWRLIVQVTDRTPDDLALETIIAIAVEAFYFTIQPSSSPLPLPNSIWQPFVLDEIASREAVVALDALLLPLIDNVVDERRF